jgi:hypothetical protein
MKDAPAPRRISKIQNEDTATPTIAATQRRPSRLCEAVPFRRSMAATPRPSAKVARLA